MHEKNYKKFFIPKKSGGFREILAPSPELKEKQRKVLDGLYRLDILKRISPYAYGFIPGKNIYENALVHVGKKYVLNVDIKDFFKSCKLENLDTETAEFLEHFFQAYEDVLFYQGYLPQGAPTSPILSNLFMRKIDRLLPFLLKIKISDDICYSRYADDITISSNSKAIFSQACLKLIESVLRKYGFEINKKKIRKMYPNRRQEVTGLIINSGRPTISRHFRRKLRAAVHNIVTGKKKVTQKELNKIKGQLAFCMQVTAHKEWAIGLLRQLGVNVKISKSGKDKAEVLIQRYSAVDHLVETIKKVKKVDEIMEMFEYKFYPGDICKIIARTKEIPKEERAKALVYVSHTVKSDWIVEKLVRNKNLFIEYVKALRNTDEYYKNDLTVQKIIRRVFEKMNDFDKKILLILFPELKEKIEDLINKQG